jgi:TolB protein
MEPLRDYLRARGIDVWTDEHLTPGTPSWEFAIEQSLRDAGALVVLMSPRSNSEESYVRREVAYALSQDKPIFPVLIDGDETSAVPFSLIGHQYVDIRGRAQQSIGEAYLRLADAISDKLGVKLVDPQAPSIDVHVAGDVQGDLQVVGRDIVEGDYVAGKPPPARQPEPAPAPVRLPRSRPAARLLPSILIAGVVVIVVGVVIVGVLLPTDLFGGGDAEASPAPESEAPEEVPVAITTPTVPTPSETTPTPGPETLDPTPVGGGSGRIVFRSDRDGDYDLYLMDADGSDVVQLTDDPFDEVVPVWSPDGSRIAYYSDKDGDLDIYVMAADGSNITQLTNNNVDDFDPFWSGDGSALAFVSELGDGVDIYTIDPDQPGAPTRLSSTSAFERFPDWSPDGSRIVFNMDQEDAEYDDIYSMAADGSDVTQLTNHPFEDHTADWSPDGSQIAFFSNRDGGAYLIYVMDADGSNVRRLTNTAANDVSPDWSPDGSLIVFERDGGIYVMNADGSNQVRMTDGYMPVWQPST